MIIRKHIAPVARLFFRLLLTLNLIFATANTFGQNEDLISIVENTERRLNARLGVTVNVLNSETSWMYRGDDRFPMSSTFKTIACAALLYRVDAGLEQLDRVVAFTEDALVTYSPVTETRVGTAGMTLAELCEATITVSDNTAGNLILDAIGGPMALTRFARSVGDEVTQLDRFETDLNEAVPGDVRDTTSPNAMASLLEELIFGEVLSGSSRTTLENWLRGNTVGGALLRAGIPEDWEIGDKTGAGGYGSRSIAAVMWPTTNNPIIATIYITETEASFEDRNAAIADIGRAIAKAVSN